MTIQPLPPLAIIVDTREQKPWQFSHLATATRGTLRVGDYSLAGHEARWAIERKSLADYVGSITSGRERFLRELSLLRRYEQACVIVEGSLGDIYYRRYRGSASPESILGTTWALCARYCPVYWAESRPYAAAMAEGLLHRWLRDEQLAAAERAKSPQMPQDARKQAGG